MNFKFLLIALFLLAVPFLTARTGVNADGSINEVKTLKVEDWMGPLVLNIYSVLFVYIYIEFLLI